MGNHCVRHLVTMHIFQRVDREISPETLDEITRCMLGPESRRTTYIGALVGSAIGSIIPFMIEPLKKSFLIFTLVGGIYGSVIARYVHGKDCLSVIDNRSHDTYRQPRKHKILDVEAPLERESIKKGSSIDIETFQQIDQQDDGFSSVNSREYQPVISTDVPEKKEKQISEGITYDELRQRNRDSFQSGNVQHKYVKRTVESKEKQSTRNEDFKSEFNTESDLFPMPSGTGNHKTKYGDIWD
ncbi:OCAD1 protein [Vespula squamosa]|uniref:OCAD1 protein n=1 Tax=Vespula squamosa TaxID=30214 RepID=A0ABD2ATH1_VESSQ